MARFLLILFAVLTAGIAYVVGQPWLYLAAGALLLGAIGLLVRNGLRERRREERRAARAEAAAEAEGDDDLHSLGIMEIRPREQKREAERATDDPPPEPAEASVPASASASSEESEEEEPSVAEEAGPDERASKEASEKDLSEEKDQKATPGAPRPAPQEHEATPAEREATDGAEKADVPEAPSTPTPNTEALNALVRAARLAVGGPVAVLLVQEELDLNYRLEALDADEDAAPLRAPGASFSTDDPLLSASAARRAVTHQAVGGKEGWTPQRLGYYRRPGEIDEERTPTGVRLVPLPLDENEAAMGGAAPPVARFLLIEALRTVPEDAVLGARKEALLEHFAELLAQVMKAPSEAEDASGAATGPAAAVASSPAAGDGAAPAAPRPRREIVAEEMEAARREGRNLALALVYLNRAEAVAGRGEEEVRGAERALRARLRRAAPDARVEPFGELTYGVFYSDARDDTEAWALALQEELSEAQDPLEGGVSVGLALMRGPEQDPAALRENATNALREAYTTGACTILE